MFPANLNTMESLLIVLLFISFVINVPTAVAYFIGMPLDIPKENACYTEIKNIKQNRMMLGGVIIYNIVNTIAIFIINLVS